MKYLLDTHALIWFCEDDNNLPLKVKELIENFEDDFYVSIATLWEISIKIKKGTLIINQSFDNIIDIIFTNGFRLLPISHVHIKELLNLPLIHKDPFDRMLITQTKFEDMVIISKEELFDSYAISRIWN